MKVLKCLCDVFRMFLCLFTGGNREILPHGLGTGVGEMGRPGQVAYSDKRYPLY